MSFKSNCQNCDKSGHTHDRCNTEKKLYKTDKKGPKRIWVLKEFIIIHCRFVVWEKVKNKVGF